jgi:hypothetical protein
MPGWIERVLRSVECFSKTGGISRPDESMIVVCARIVAQRRAAGIGRRKDSPRKEGWQEKVRSVSFYPRLCHGMAKTKGERKSKRPQLFLSFAAVR